MPKNNKSCVRKLFLFDGKPKIEEKQKKGRANIFEITGITMGLEAWRYSDLINQ